MNRLIQIKRDDEGSAVVEFAVAVPILVSFIYGIANIGMIMAASAGMQHALGEAARLSTICVNPTITGCSVPTTTELSAKVTATVYGTRNGTLSALSVTPGPSATTGNNYRDLSLTYTQPLKFLFINVRTVSITRTKRVYLAQ